jgi:hypothetical protein
MATITFYANEGIGAINSGVQNMNGSGLGFFGNGGAYSSVRINEYQDRTFISNANGTVAGAEIDNVKYVNSTGAMISRGGTVDASLGIKNIPNYKSTLNIRFTDSNLVRTQNAKVQIYDRSNLSNGPSGVICQVCEVVHPETSQAVLGSGSAAWVPCSGSSPYLTLVDSPGTSGISPSGSNTYDTTHDWYVCVSASPTGIGSHTAFGMYFYVEYL